MVQDVMNGKNAIFYLLNRILDARAITPTGKPVSISPIHVLRGFPRHDLENILEKLERDEKVLVVIDRPIPNMSLFAGSNRTRNYELKLLPKFDSYFKNIQADPDYQEFTGIKPSAETNTQPNDEQAAEVNNVPKFDVVFKAIIFNNTIIPITGPNQIELCTILFKNAKSLKKNWDNDEICEKAGEDESTRDPSKYYRAARAINKAVFDKTHADKLLLETMTTVRVNPIYL